MINSFVRCLSICCLLIVAQTHAEEPSSALHPSSQWTAASWDDLPGVFEDNPREALSAWLASCSRSQAVWRATCNELEGLKNADSDVLRIWMMSRLQPYRVNAGDQGLLTGYYEPVFNGKRSPDAQFKYPLYRLPAQLQGGHSTRVWFTRQDMDTLLDAQSALQGRAIAYLDNPLDVLALQIQGSGQLSLMDTDSNGGVSKLVRLAFSGSNNQPYKSVGAWLRDQYGLRDLSWPSIRAWAQNHPEQTDALLWSNPRVVFFKEEAVGANNAGPRGAQGVPLMAGRSIAIDPKSIPYGTPVWLASSGNSLELKRLVLAQDTGSAIVGAVRADYFVGSGSDAGEIAGKLKQPLQLWVLWPK